MSYKKLNILRDNIVNNPHVYNLDLSDIVKILQAKSDKDIKKVVLSKKINLEKLFDDNHNCYSTIDHGGQTFETIPTMTKEKFVETLKKVLINLVD